jgi:hypothetical protein
MKSVYSEDKVKILDDNGSELASVQIIPDGEEDYFWLADMDVKDSAPPTTLLKLLRACRKAHGGKNLACTVELENSQWEELVDLYEKLGFYPTLIVMQRNADE